MLLVFFCIFFQFFSAHFLEIGGNFNQHYFLLTLFHEKRCSAHNLTTFLTFLAQRHCIYISSSSLKTCTIFLTFSKGFFLCFFIGRIQEFLITEKYFFGNKKKAIFFLISAQFLVTIICIHIGSSYPSYTLYSKGKIKGTPRGL